MTRNGQFLKAFDEDLLPRTSRMDELQYVVNLQSQQHATKTSGKKHYVAALANPDVRPERCYYFTDLG